MFPFSMYLRSGALPILLRTLPQPNLPLINPLLFSLLGFCHRFPYIRLVSLHSIQLSNPTPFPLIHHSQHLFWVFSHITKLIVDILA